MTDDDDDTPMIEDAPIAEGVQHILQLAWCHISNTDSDALADMARIAWDVNLHPLPTAVCYPLGQMVFVTPGPYDEQLGALRERGFSQAFIDIYTWAARNDIPIIDFNDDAVAIASLPVFLDDEQLTLAELDTL